MTRRVLITLLAGSLLLPAAANARVQPETHASARTERVALQVANAFWQQRGLTACTSPRIEYTVLAQRASADSFIGPNLAAAYCVIRVNPRLEWRGRAGAIDYCWTIVHERGHQAGLKHTAAGIMREDGGDRPPAACIRALSARG